MRHHSANQIREMLYDTLTNLGITAIQSKTKRRIRVTENGTRYNLYLIHKRPGTVTIEYQTGTEYTRIYGDGKEINEKDIYYVCDALRLMGCHKASKVINAINKIYKDITEFVKPYGLITEIRQKSISLMGSGCIPIEVRPNPKGTNLGCKTGDVDCDNYSLFTGYDCRYLGDVALSPELIINKVAQKYDWVHDSIFGSLSQDFTNTHHAIDNGFVSLHAAVAALVEGVVTIEDRHVKKQVVYSPTEENLYFHVYLRLLLGSYLTAAHILTNGDCWYQLSSIAGRSNEYMMVAAKFELNQYDKMMIGKAIEIFMNSEK